MARPHGQGNAVPSDNKYIKQERYEGQLGKTREPEFDL